MTENLISFSLLGLSFLLLFIHLLESFIYAGRMIKTALGRTVAVQNDMPSVSLLISITERDAFDEGAVLSALTQEYPAYEVIFCANHPDDPAVRIVRDLMKKYTFVKAHLLIGKTDAFKNPKLNSISKGWDAARGKLVCISDANILLDHHFIAKHVTSWQASSNGVVLSSPKGIFPRNWSAYSECSFMNRIDGFMDYLTYQNIDKKTFLVNKKELSKLGGLAKLDGSINESIACASLMRKNSLTTKNITHPGRYPLDRRVTNEINKIQLALNISYRKVSFFKFLLQPLGFAIIPIILCYIGIEKAELNPLYILCYIYIWYIPEIMLAWIGGWPAGWRMFISAIWRDIMMVLLWIASWFLGDEFFRKTRASYTIYKNNPTTYNTRDWYSE